MSSQAQDKHDHLVWLAIHTKELAYELAEFPEYQTMSDMLLKHADRIKRDADHISNMNIITEQKETK